MNRIEGKAIKEVEKYPLFFQEFYTAYEKSKGWEIVFIADNETAVIPVKRRTTRFVKQAQYLYPPLKNGKRLSPEEEKKFLERNQSICLHSHLLPLRLCVSAPLR